MFFNGTHKELATSLETIGAAFAIFEKSNSNSDLTLVSANGLFEQISYKLLDDAIGVSINEILPRYIMNLISGTLEQCLSNQTAQEKELIIDREGKSNWWRLVASPVISEQLSHQRIIVTFINISDKKQLELELGKVRQRFEAVVETAYDGVITIDKNHNIKLINQSAQEIFRLGEENVVGAHISRLIPESHREKHDEYVRSFEASPIKARPMQSRVAVRGLRADGTEFPIEVTISKINVGHDVEMTAVIRDISERARMIDELSKAATHDSLTDLINRRHGVELIEKEINRSIRLNHTCTIAILDIDYFKQINDEYGHNAGDQILVEFSNEMMAAVRNIDMVCRWGGEEFVVMLPETNCEQAKIWAERTRKAVEQKTTELESGEKVRITISVGIASLESNTSIKELVRQADDALYRAKDNGRNRVEIYEP
jgi:diguanylate cyclase (GGDEF)-like protein/PAS domain S-box-containing protein